MKRSWGKILAVFLVLLVPAGAAAAFAFHYQGWIPFGKKSRYWDRGHFARDEWEEINGVSYRFDEEGDLCEGWREETAGTSYYRGGLPAVGDTEIDGKDYYFDDQGIMRTGMITMKGSGGKTFYYGEDGARQTGWVEQAEGKYYFTEDGMQTGKAEIDGALYCFGKDGILITEPFREGDDRYFPGEDGALRINQWIREDYGTYYAGKDGKAVAGKQDIDGTVYLFGSDGRLIRNRWVGNSHSDSRGVMQTNCMVDGLFLDADGSKVFSGTYGDGGNLFIPSVDVEVPVYKTEGDEHGQEITDRSYSAALLTTFNMPVIADHKNQGFERIKSCMPGKTKALMLTKNKVTEYICEDIIEGSNVEDDILDPDGISIDESGADLCLYTCNEDWQHVTIVYFIKK